MSRLRGMYGTDPRALFTIRVLSGILLMFDIEMRAGMLFFDWYQMEMFYGPDGVRPTTPQSIRFGTVMFALFLRSGCGRPTFLTLVLSVSDVA